MGDTRPGSMSVLDEGCKAAEGHPGEDYDADVDVNVNVEHWHNSVQD